MKKTLSFFHGILQELIICLVFSLLVIKANAQQGFTTMPATQTGINFQNRLVESPAVNIITYEYFYNGGGVAAGDFNRDGLVDLYFTANMSPNKLYLNKGGFQFEDISKQSGTAGRPGWKTGVSVADVNGDGWLDIYVCYSGDLDSNQRANQLFINNGDLTFTDRAREMGVNDKGYTTHAAFFDMDNDGDLDLYVLNHNIKNLRNFDAAFVKKMVDPDAGDRLYENNNGHFRDVSRKAGIRSNPLGYGLGLAIADLNNDGWSDIYVSNDYVEEDYLYINNQNGTFSETLKSSLGHLSNFSMGIDVADINNDGLADIYTLDMLPEDNRRQKLLYAPDNYELYNNTLQNGFYHQLMRNMLHLNNGNGSFSEVGQLAGVSNTDWSWAALFADFNHDGRKDLFVTNGYGRDMINRDFMKFYADERLKHIQGKTDQRMFQMLQGIQSTPLHNYIYENTNGIVFKDRSKEWGFSELNFSHGAVYADLDNDGDLDLVCNRMNQEAGIFRNDLVQSGKGQHFLKIELHFPGPNHYAIGSAVTLFTPSGNQHLQFYPVHGFQSSMHIPLHFGFNNTSIDSIGIRWPNGQKQIIREGLRPDTFMVIEQVAGKAPILPEKFRQGIFRPKRPLFSYKHEEDQVNDFKIQPLMTNMYSYSGPRFARGDVNGDKLEDLYVCGPRNHPGRFFIAQKDGRYREEIPTVFANDVAYEDVHATFLDADGDGDQDLYVVSGGYQVDDESYLQDRLYYNEKGKWIQKTTALPKERSAGAVAVVLDYDGDGDQDLFVPGRVVPGAYPTAPSSLLLENDGKGQYKDRSMDIGQSLNRIGMVTDASWLDINGDGKKELVIIGEWMSMRVFAIEGNVFRERTENHFEKTLKGWWNRMHWADLDGDGDLDMVAGNWGMNSQLRPSDSIPITLHYGDFDNNGFVDPLLCYPILGKSYPMASRDEITDQMVYLRQRYPTYDAYADAVLEEILDSAQRASAQVLSADFLHTVWFENQKGRMVMHKLPLQADYAPVYAIATDDFDRDGYTDILLAGNIEYTRIKIGKIDANQGILLKGDGKGGFRYVDQVVSGLQIKSCVRDLVLLKDPQGQQIVLVGINENEPLFLTY